MGTYPGVGACPGHYSTLSDIESMAACVPLAHATCYNDYFYAASDLYCAVEFVPVIEKFSNYRGRESVSDSIKFIPVIEASNHANVGSICTMLTTFTILCTNIPIQLRGCGKL